MEPTVKPQALDLDRIFTYHPPKGTQQARYVELREKAKEFALLIDKNCPASPEKTLAIRHIQMAIMFANASIAINE